MDQTLPITDDLPQYQKTTLDQQPMIWLIHETRCQMSMNHNKKNMEFKQHAHSP